MGGNNPSRSVIVEIDGPISPGAETDVADLSNQTPEIHHTLEMKYDIYDFDILFFKGEPPKSAKDFFDAMNSLFNDSPTDAEWKVEVIARLKKNEGRLRFFLIKTPNGTKPNELDQPDTPFVKSAVSTSTEANNSPKWGIVFANSSNAFAQHNGMWTALQPKLADKEHPIKLCTAGNCNLDTSSKFTFTIGAPSIFIAPNEYNCN